MIFRTEELRRAGGFDPEVISFDTDILWRIAARWPIVLSRQPGVLHFVYDTSIVTRIEAATWLEALRHMYAKTGSAPRDCSADAAARLREVISGSYARMALQAIEASDRDTAAAGAILRREMNQPRVGRCFERIAASPLVSRPVARLIHESRRWQGSYRKRKFGRLQLVHKNGSRSARGESGR